MMHYKSFAGLLLAAPALASPSYEYEEPSVPSLASGSVPPPYYDIPLSAIPVIASAIPSTWVEKMMDDPAARQAMIDAIESGAYPPWYYELPATIKLYASKVAVEQLYYFNQAPPTVVPSISTPIITPTSWWSVSPSPAVYTTTPARSSSTPLRTSSRTGSSTTSGSGSSTSSGSGSASSTVGGAPAATAGAATLAGAGIAALFGVALAL